MGKKSLALLAACAGAAAVGAWIHAGKTGPIHQYTPYLVTLNRPELRPYKDALLKGNEWAVTCSPATAALGLACKGEDCAFGLQALSNQAKSGKPVFYPVYSAQQRAADPDLEWVGIYHLEGKTEEKKPFVAMIAGGGFASVCTMWESLPVSAAFQQMGYHSFCIQYRTHKEFGKAPETLMADIAACLSYICDNAEEFGVLPEDYLLGGFSAGSVTTSMWANAQLGWEKFHLPKPGAVCLLYGVNREETGEKYDVPTFCRYCLQDQYFTDPAIFTDFQAKLESKGIPTDFKGVHGGHGFGLGSKTDAAGWPEEAEQFWLTNRKENRDES